MANQNEVTIIATLKDQVSKGLESIEKRFTSFLKSVNVAGSIISAPFKALGGVLDFVTKQIFNLRNILVAGLAGSILDTFAKFEKGLLLVQAELGNTAVNLKELGNGVLAISRETGTGFQDLLAALKNLAGAGVDVSKQIDILGASTKLAALDAASAETGVKAVLTVLKAYGLEAKDAARVTDLLGQALETGDLSIDNLAGSLQTVGPIAKEAGLSLEDLLAAISVLSKRLGPEDAISSITSILKNFVKASPEAKELAAGLGLEFNKAAISGGKFADFLEKLAKNTDLQPVVFEQLFKNLKATTAAQILGSNNAKEFRQALDDLGNSAGIVDRKYKQLATSLQIQFDRLKAAFVQIFIVIGEAAKPFVESGLNKIQEFLDNLLDSKNRIQAVLAGIVGTISRIATVITTAFSQGDILQLISNIISAGFKLATSLIISGAPFLGTAIANLARIAAATFVESFLGSTKKELAASVSNSSIASGLVRVLLGKDTLDELQAFNKDLKDTEATINALTARLPTLQANVGGASKGLQSITFSQFGKPQLQFLSEPEAQKLLDDTKRTLESLKAKRDKLIAGSLNVGEIADKVSLENRTAMQSASEKFLATTHDALISAIETLPKGVQNETKKAIDDLTQFIGTQLGVSFDAAKIKDLAEKKATEAAKAAQSAVKKTATTVAPQDNQQNFSSVVDTVTLGVNQLSTLFEDVRRKREDIKNLLDGGFISSAEGAKRDKEALDSFNQFSDRLTSLISSTAAQSPAVGQVLEPLRQKIVEIRSEINKTQEDSGTLFTGFEAGIRNTVSKFDEFRELGLALGATFANSLVEIVDLFAKGKKSFSEFALEFLSQIARMIIQLAIFKTLSGIFGAASPAKGTDPNFIGPVLKNKGGPVPGPSNVRRDVIPAMLTPGENVINADAVQHYGGHDVFNALNKRLIPKHVVQGLMGYSKRGSFHATRLFAGGGAASGSMGTGGGSSGPVEATIVSNEQAMDRLLAGGGPALLKFMRRHRDILGYGSGR